MTAIDRLTLTFTFSILFLLFTGDNTHFTAKCSLLSWNSYIHTAPMNIKQLRWSGSTTGQRVCSSVPGSCIYNFAGKVGAGKPTVLSGDVQKGHLTSSCLSGFTLSGEMRCQTRDCAQAIYLHSQAQLFEKSYRKEGCKVLKVGCLAAVWVWKWEARVGR